MAKMNMVLAALAALAMAPAQAGEPFKMEPRDHPGLSDRGAPARTAQRSARPAEIDMAWGEVWGLETPTATLDIAAIETASVKTSSPRAGWGEVWGLEPALQTVTIEVIETASLPMKEVWGEVWGLGAAPAAETEQMAMAGAETDGWGEVWGLSEASFSASIETASLPTPAAPSNDDEIWGEIWLGDSQEPDTAAIATASIPAIEQRQGADSAWGEVWGL